jgi:30S ribosome assembly GTPase
MNKVCVGCGIVLQNTNPEALGYTPKLENDYCMRCFKIKNYGQNINKNIAIDNASIIASINDFNAYVIFLTDFINLSSEVIKTFNLIKNPKKLVVTKSDLIPSNLKEEHIISNIKDTYHIKELVELSTSKTDVSNLFKDISTNVILCGYTSSGKSTLINKLCSSSIVTSHDITTTLDFIPIPYNGYTIYDTPGFVYKNRSLANIKKPLKPITKTIKPGTELMIDELIISPCTETNLTLYIPGFLNTKKRHFKSNLENDTKVFKNSDILLPGTGFILVSKTCIIKSNQELDVRKSIIGRDYK